MWALLLVAAVTSTARGQAVQGVGRRARGPGGGRSGGGIHRGRTDSIIHKLTLAGEHLASFSLVYSDRSNAMVENYSRGTIVCVDRQTIREAGIHTLASLHGSTLHSYTLYYDWQGVLHG